MFKGLSGLKNVVKGGFSAVAEQTGQLADKVVSDPSTSQGHLKESLKQKVSNVLDSGESAINSNENAGEAKEKAKNKGASQGQGLGCHDTVKNSIIKHHS